jgi:hypothetical protein
MWERSVPGTNHVEFEDGGYSRLIYLDSGTDTNNRAHATAMAGTIAAAGVNGLAEGMASTATILAMDSVGDTTEMATNAVLYGIRLSNHSYGLPMGWDDLPGYKIWYGGGPTDYYDLNFGSYLDKSQMIDSLAYTHQGYLSVWPTGNDRDDNNYSGQPHLHLDFLSATNICSHTNDTHYFNGYRTLTPESSAKNIIAVSSVHDLPNGWQSAGGVMESSFSNRGPTRDGRTKPDLAANGQDVYSSSTDANGNDTYAAGSGTSSAAANVTGATVLVYERFAQVGHPEPSAALVKATLLGTAKEAGTPGPDYIYGQGLMDTAGAVDLILTNKYFFNPGGGLLKSCFYEGVLTNGTYLDFSVYKNVGEQLRVMLVWTDPPGYVSHGPTNSMLVNDLDVEIVHGGVTNLSYALNPANPTAAATATGNFRDNAELNIWPNNNDYAQFTLRVKHKGTLKDAGYLGNTTNQPFALVVMGHILQPVPQIVDIAQTSSNQVTVSWSGAAFNHYKVQYLNEVDAPASAWTDATGWLYTTTNPAATALTMPTNAPQRFYRVLRQL